MNKFNTKNLNPIIYINISIFVLIILGLIGLFTDTHLSGIFDPVLISNLKYYSLVINIIEGMFLILLITFLLLLKKKIINNIPTWINVINLVITSNLVVNFLFNILYIVPRLTNIGDPNPEFIITGSNVIFNLIVPTLAFIQFAFFLKNNKLKAFYSVFAILPFCIYFVIYTCVALSHALPDGSIPLKYDWYGFCTHNAGYLVLWLVLFVGATFGISNVLCLINRKVNLNDLWAKLLCNVILFILSSIGFWWMLYYAFINIEPNLGAIKTILKRFVYMSNLCSLLMLVSSALCIIFYSLIISGKIKKMPIGVDIIKQGVIIMLLILFLTEFCSAIFHFATKSKLDAIGTIWRRLYKKHLIFEHFLTPLVGIAVFIFVEHKEFKFKHNFYSALPFAIYFLFYTIGLYAHINVKWSEDLIWDVYNVLKYTNYKVVWLLPFACYVVAYVISLLFWLINKRVNKFYLKNKKINYQFK